MSVADRSDRSSVRSLGSTKQRYDPELQQSAKQYDAEASQQGGGALGGFGILLRPGVSQRLETQGQSIFCVVKVDRGGPAHTAGMRPDDTLESVDGSRVKTWDDAARLLLGSVGTSASLRWHSSSANQHKSARIRRVAASPHDLEILLFQQRQRRSSRGSSKGIFSQASAGWKWFKKQAGGADDSSKKQVFAQDSTLSSNSREHRGSRHGSQRGSSDGGGIAGSGSVREERSSWSQDEGSNYRSFGERVVQPRVEIQIDQACSINNDRAQAAAGMPPSPLTHTAVAMWTDAREVGKGKGGAKMASHERVVMNGYLQHAVDLAREGSSRGEEAPASPQHGGGVVLEKSVQSALTTGGFGSESQESRDSGMEDADSETGSKAGSSGWKKKVKKAVGRVVKEVTVRVGADREKGPQLSRSTLQGSQAGVGVALAAGSKGTVVVAEVAPWIWAGKHGLSFPLSVGDVVTHVDDFLVAGEREDLIGLRDELSKKYELKVQMAGWDEGDDKEFTFLGRTIRLSHEWGYDGG